MPLPFVLGAGAAVAATLGVGSAVSGAMKLKETNERQNEISEKHEKNIARFEAKNKEATTVMDDLGEKELRILDSFDEFTALIGRIHNRPQFKAYQKDGVDIPQYNPEELNQVAVGAAALLGGLGGAAVGTAGGFAAAGVTTSAVMALGTASTGTAIASLSGVAATNATLAALGGGALAAGGGGMALGATILSATTLGAGLLVGGLLFNGVASNLSDKANEAEAQMLKAEKEVDKICKYLNELMKYAKRFDTTLSKVDSIYSTYRWRLKRIVITNGKTDWNQFTPEEKLTVENAVLLVGLLYNMCKVQLVLKSDKKDQMNRINIAAIDDVIHDTDYVLETQGLY